MACQRSMTHSEEKKKDGVPKKYDTKKRKDGVPKKYGPKKMERESVKKRSCHPPCALVRSVSKHKHYFSMDPIFDLVIGVMQV